MWNNQKPTEEGWYFWRKRRDQKDPWKWNAYYYIDSPSPFNGIWENGVGVQWPKGGWWLKIANPHCHDWKAD